MVEHGQLRSEESDGSSKKLEDDVAQCFVNDPFTGMDQRGSSNNGSDTPTATLPAEYHPPGSFHDLQESGPPPSAANIQLPPSASASDQPPIPYRHPARSEPATVNPERTVPPGYPQPPLLANAPSSGSQHETDAVAVTPPPRTPPPAVPMAVPTASPYVPHGRHLNGRRREMTPCSNAESAHRIWGHMSTLQKIILSLVMLLMVSTVITMITVFRTAGRGDAAVSKRILLCGMLIIVASSVAAMFAIQKNVGEVLLTMTMLLVLGIFLSSFQDVIYGS